MKGRLTGAEEEGMGKIECGWISVAVGAGLQFLTEDSSLRIVTGKPADDLGCWRVYLL